tara:strand:+ start:783 stop:1295 length:513 start_codon:yes stop_codon:yes gene_type:complete
MNGPTKLLTILLSSIIIAGCGPSEEEIREQIRLEQEQERERIRLEQEQEREKKIQETLNGWKAVVETYDALKESGEYESLIEGSQMYITDDGKGLVFRESQYEMLGLIAYSMFIGDLIPDYIQERISNTAPIDGNQKEQFDNVEVNWSIDRSGSSSLGRIEIYINLRLVD